MFHEWVIGKILLLLYQTIGAFLMKMTWKNSLLHEVNAHTPVSHNEELSKIVNEGKSK